MSEGQRKSVIRDHPREHNRIRSGGEVQCKVCGVPSGNEPAAEWLDAWGHRCPHGEPCPSFSGQPTGCIRCRQPALELFACTRLHARLTRRACGEQWRKANAGKLPPGSEAMAAAGRFGSPCTGCPIGKAHAAGEQPDVELADVNWADSMARSTRPAQPAVPGVNAPARAPASEPQRRAARGEGAPSPASVPAAKHQVEDDDAGETPAQQQEDTMAKQGKKCGECGERFEPGHHRQKYCDECRDTPRVRPSKPTSRRRTPAPASEGGTRAAQILEAVGYEVHEMEAPGGVVLFVEDPAA